MRSIYLALSKCPDQFPAPTVHDLTFVTNLAEGGEAVARDGSGKLVEVYPAAALRVWRFDATGYKRKENRDSRCKLLGGITEATTPWLTVPTAVLSSCEASDDALDALIAAMVARAAAAGLCEPIPAESSMGAARRDGSPCLLLTVWLP